MARTAELITAELYTLLSALDQNQSLIPELAAVVAADGRISRAEGKRLVALFKAGVAHDSLLEQLLPHVNVSDRMGSQWLDSGTNCGDYGVRSRIIAALHEASKDAVKALPEREEYARTAVLLALQDGFVNGIPTAGQLLRDEVFVKTTGWNSTQISTARQLLDGFDAVTKVYVRRLAQAAEQLDHLIAQPDGNDQGILHFTASIDALFSMSDGRLDICWQAAHLLWRAMNLFRSTENEAGTKEIQRLAEAWQTKLADSHARRWLSDAVTRVGTKPTSSGIRVMRNAL